MEISEILSKKYILLWIEEKEETWRNKKKLFDYSINN